MAITISGENNNDRILAQDGVIDQISGINIVGLITASHINVGSNIQLGNAGIITATTFVGNVTGNVNSTSPLLLQTGGSERFRITGDNALGIAGANYGSSGQVLTSGGSGSAVTWSAIPSQVTISSNADNRIITGGSGTNLVGEANFIAHAPSSGVGYVELKHGGSSGDYGYYQIRSGSTLRGRLGSNYNVDAISLDTAGGSSTAMIFKTGSSQTERLRITSTGQVLIGTTTTPSDTDTKLRVHTTNTSSGVALEISQPTNGVDKTAAALGIAINNGGASTNAADLYFETAISGSTTERVRITRDGKLLVGLTADPAESSIVAEGNSISGTSYAVLDLRRGQAASSSGSVCGYIRFSDTNIDNSNRNYAWIAGMADGTSSDGSDNPGRLVFATCPDNGTAVTERLRITSGGRVRIGNANNLALWGQNNRLQVAGTDWSSSGITIACMGTGGSSNLVMGNSRGSTPGTALQSGDRLGYISFVGDDGTDMHTVGAAIVAETDGNSSSNSVPGDLQFYTGGNNSTDRLRITSTGQILIGTGAIATPKASVGGLDVASGLYSIVMGGEANTGDGTPRANSAAKEARLCVPHYTNAEEPLGAVVSFTQSGASYLRFGGGSSIVNAATEIGFYTAANTTTTSGTERFKITSDGNIYHTGGRIFSTRATGEAGVLIGSGNAGGATLYLDGDSNGDWSGGDYAYIRHNTGGNLEIRATNPNDDGQIQFYTGNGSTYYGGIGSTGVLSMNGAGNSRAIEINPGGNASTLVFDRSGYVTSNIRAGDGGSNVAGGSGGGSRLFLSKNEIYMYTFNYTSNIGDAPSYSQKFRIDTSGNFHGSSSNNISDQRLKKDIVTITDPLTKIKGLTGRTFKWKEDSTKFDDKTKYGFIAQEVETTIPELVDTEHGIVLFDKDDKVIYDEDAAVSRSKSVNETGVIPITVEALKVLISKVEILEAKVAALEGS